jgi:hypothetical protein
MRAMRDTNDGRDDSLIVIKTIVCHSRRNKPHLYYQVCEQKCDDRNECENYRAWFKMTFKEELPRVKKRRVKNAPLTREEIQKRDEQIAGKTEAYNILLQTIATKPKIKKLRKKKEERKA